jgi:hypothetical protein
MAGNGTAKHDTVATRRDNGAISAALESIFA